MRMLKTEDDFSVLNFQINLIFDFRLHNSSVVSEVFPFPEPEIPGENNSRLCINLSIKSICIYILMYHLKVVV